MRQARRARDREARPRRPTDATAKALRPPCPELRRYTIRAHFTTFGIAGNTTVTTMKGGSMALGSLEVRLHMTSC
jgi:hypothetical protein